MSCFVFLASLASWRFNFEEQIMSEHAWTQEHIAVAVAGGLEAADVERLDAHVRDCSACAAALADARRLDRGLSTLFTAARPGPAAEDRLIRSLWAMPAPRAPRSGRFWPKILWGVAASVGIGLTGAGMTLLAGNGALPFPGATGWDQSSDPISKAIKKPRSILQDGMKWSDTSLDLDIPDRGLDPDDRRTNYNIDRIEDVPAQSQKQQSARESQLARTPDEMARQLSQRTLNGTTEAVDGERSGKLRGWALGTVDYDGKELKDNNATRERLKA